MQQKNSAHCLFLFSWEIDFVINYLIVSAVEQPLPSTVCSGVFSWQCLGSAIQPHTVSASQSLPLLQLYGNMGHQCEVVPEDDGPLAHCISANRAL